MKKGLASRLLSVRILLAVDKGSLADSFFQGEDFKKLNAADRSLVNNIVYGVLRNRAKIDFLLKKISGGKRIRPTERNILRIVAYQKLFLDRIPDFAVISTAMETASFLGIGKVARGFLRACISRIIEKYGCRENFEELFSSASESIRYNMPDWIIDYLKATIDENVLKRYLELCSLKPTVRIYPFPGKADSSELYEFLDRNGLSYEKNNEGCTLSVFYPELNSLLKDSKIYVQSPCQHNHLKLLRAGAEDTVLEIGAAPGGKTLLLSEIVGEKGQVISCEKNPERIKLLQKRVAGLRYRNVQVLQLDILHADDVLQQQGYSYIVIDAPCGNLGELCRNPEVRWRLSPKYLLSLAAIQKDILKESLKYLADGGELLFMTCSLGKYEVEDLIIFAENILKLKTVVKQVTIPGGKNYSGGSAVLFSHNS